MKNFIKPILAVLIFIFFQFVGTIIEMVYVLITEPEQLSALLGKGDSEFNMAEFLTPNALSLSLIISGLLTIIFLFAFKFVDRKTVFNTSVINLKWAPIVVFGAFSGIFASNMMMEWVDLPNLLEAQFLGMSQTAIGIFAIGILGPVVEELTFREAFISNLVKRNVSPWVAIVLSALCFGLIHGNPAQIPFAFIIGLVLAIVYYKTGNIVLSSIIHILNNSIAVIQMNILGEYANDFMFKDALGAADIPVIIILAAFCIFILYKFWNRYISNI